MTSESAEQVQQHEIAGTAASRGQRFAQVLHAIEAEARAQGTVVSRRSVAKQARVTSPAVTAWFKGSQMPRSDKLDAIAMTYAAGDGNRLQQIRRRLYDAAGSDLSAPIRRSPMERLEDGRIRIGLLDYPPVSGFLEQLLTAFGKYAHFDAAITSTPSVASLATPPGAERLNGDRMDIVSGIFATPGRARHFHFIETPLAMGVNVLTFASETVRLEDKGAGDLHAQDPSGRSPGRRPIMPIVNLGESGHLFANSVLGFKDREMHMCAYSASELTQALVEAVGGDRVPLVIADELTILSVYERLIERFADDKLDYEKYREPMVLLAPTQAQDELTTNDFYPIFNIPIGIGKGDDEWFEYVRSAWSIFIKSNVRYVAPRYAALYSALQKRVSEMCDVVDKNPDRFGDGPGASELSARIEQTWKERIRSWLFDNQLSEWSSILKEAERLSAGDAPADLRQEGADLLERIGNYVDRVDGLARTAAASRSDAEGDGK